MQKAGFDMQSTSRLVNTGLVMAVVIAGLSGCAEWTQHKKPNFTFMPDMHFSPAIKAQEKGAQRMPVEGTITREKDLSIPSSASEIVAMKNPLPRSREVFERGQARFNIYCMPCHGAGGEGDGTVVPKFPRPPSLTSERVRGYPDGRIFYVMTKGQGLMPSYASQVSAEDRWAITHYIRALDLAKNPPQGK